MKNFIFVRFTSPTPSRRILKAMAKSKTDKKPTDKKPAGDKSAGMSPRELKAQLMQIMRSHYESQGSEKGRFKRHKIYSQTSS